MSGSMSNAAERLGQVAPDAEPASEQGNGAKRTGSLARLNISPEAIRTLPAEFVTRHRVLLPPGQRFGQPRSGGG